MALGTDKQLYIALGLLAALGGVWYWQSQEKAKAAKAYEASSVKVELPKLEIKDDVKKKIDKIVIKKPKDEEAKSEALELTLEKKGESWQVTKPVDYLANQSNVDSLLENLQKLEANEQITVGADYDSFKLDEKRALRVQVFTGGTKVTDLYFGDSGSRGQTARLEGTTGVFAVKGYSKFLFARDLKDWRERSITKIEPKQVVRVELTNESGTYVFARGEKQAEESKDEKKDGKKDAAPAASGSAAPAGSAAPKADDKPAPWQGNLRGKDKDGKDAEKEAPIEKFDDAKVDDLLRAFQALSADNFGDGKQDAEVGLDKPAATLTITLADGTKKVFRFGANSDGSSRWLKLDGNAQLFSVSSFSADWALAKPEKFQKSDKKEEKKDEPGGMPPMGMPPMGGDPHGGMH